MARQFNGAAGAWLNFGPVDTDAPNLKAAWAFWLWLDNIANTDVLLVIESSANVVVNQLRTTGTGGLLWQQSFQLGLGDTVKDVQTDGGLLTSGAWHHIVLNNQGTPNPADGDAIWIDGVEATYSLRDAANGANVPEGGDWIWGGRKDNSSNLRGRMAELYYRGHPLQQREIESLATGASPLFYIRDPLPAFGFFRSSSTFYAPLWGYAPELSWVKGDFPTARRATVPSGVTDVKHPRVYYPRNPRPHASFVTVIPPVVTVTPIECVPFIAGCPQDCPPDPAPMAPTIISLANPSFLSPLFLLGLTSPPGGSAVMTTPTDCGAMFANNLAAQECV